MIVGQVFLRLKSIDDYINTEYVISDVAIKIFSVDISNSISELQKIANFNENADIDSRILVSLSEITQDLSELRIQVRAYGKMLTSANNTTAQRQARESESLIFRLTMIRNKLENIIKHFNEEKNNMGVDVVFVTALQDELVALLSKLPNYKRSVSSNDDIRNYFTAQLPIKLANGSMFEYSVVVTPLIGMGRVQASLTTTDAIRRWNPRYVILVGIAGGVAANNVKPGDILIAEQVVDYELQKIRAEEEMIRWETFRSDPRLLGHSQILLYDDWKDLISAKRPIKGVPSKHFGPIATGDKVVALGKTIDKYRDIWVKLIGIEMEAGGVASAVHQAPTHPGFFMIRSASDLADAKKDDRWRRYACDIAASFAVGFLKTGPIPVLNIQD